MWVQVVWLVVQIVPAFWRVHLGMWSGLSRVVPCFRGVFSPFVRSFALLSLHCLRICLYLRF